jgi:hypothetical protein
MILREAGARVVERLFTAAENRLEYILADPNPPRGVPQRAEYLNIPVVSPEWVIEVKKKKMK